MKIPVSFINGTSGEASMCSVISRKQMREMRAPLLEDLDQSGQPKITAAKAMEYEDQLLATTVEKIVVDGKTIPATRETFDELTAASGDALVAAAHKIISPTSEKKF